MALWFETKVRYNKMQSNGLVKKVTEAFLVDALTFTEAEKKITEHVTPFIDGDYTVNAVKKTKIAEIFHKDSERFWIAKIGSRTFDEHSASEKIAVSEILIGASDFDEAYKRAGEGMKGTISDWELIALSESQVIEVVD